LLELFR